MEPKMAARWPSVTKAKMGILKFSLIKYRQNESSSTLSHCSKSSFYVQKFNFHFPRKLSIFLGEKLAKMLWYWTF